MMAAEQWYSYQNDYQKYGIDLTPSMPRKPREKQSALTVTAKDKKTLLGLLVVIGVACLLLIVLKAWSASITYDINQMQIRESALQNEIANLTVDIKTASSISTIEQKATRDLGMIYADMTNVVFVADENIENFSVALKAQVYQ